jgi:peroxiredoxin family protein
LNRAIRPVGERLAGACRPSAEWHDASRRAALAIPPAAIEDERMDDSEQPLNLVLFSGTDDKLEAAAVLAAGAAALGRPVHIFLQYWALNAVRSDGIGGDHGLAPEAGTAGRASVDALAAAGQSSWPETLRQVKEIGEVDIQACSLSMDLLHLEHGDLDPLVDGVEGVTSFWLSAAAGQVVFI